MLNDFDIGYLTSVEVGAGSLLAEAALDDVTFALVVLPQAQTEGIPPGLTAVLVEAGVVLGRGIPTLLIAETDDSVPPALLAVPRTVVSLDNADALRLQIRVFSRTTALALPDRPVVDTPMQPVAFDIDAEREAFNQARTAGVLRFDRYLFDLFNRLGADVVTNAELSDPQSESRYEVDGILAVHSGSGIAIVFVEVSHGPMTLSRLRDKSLNLQQKMRAARPDFGLIVYVDDYGALPLMPAPFIVAMPIRQLLDELRDHSLYQILVGARNRVVHGV